MAICVYKHVYWDGTSLFWLWGYCLIQNRWSAHSNDAFYDIKITQAKERNHLCCCSQWICHSRYCFRDISNTQCHLYGWSMAFFDSILPKRFGRLVFQQIENFFGRCAVRVPRKTPRRLTQRQRRHWNSWKIDTMTKKWNLIHFQKIKERMLPVVLWISGERAVIMVWLFRNRIIQVCWFTWLVFIGGKSNMVRISIHR